jgi:hypothetical protein
MEVQDSFIVKCVVKECHIDEVRIGDAEVIAGEQELILKSAKSKQPFTPLRIPVCCL